MRVAIVGATGMVGREMLKVLQEERVQISDLIPVASERSVGTKISYCEQEYPVVGIAQAVSLKPDIALFSAGGATSLAWAKKFNAVGTVVIDNSSTWRMNEEVPLVVPEVNFDSLTAKSKLIANPNCSTIQLVMVLWPLHRLFGLERVVVSTYQSVTGTGKNALRQLESEEQGTLSDNIAYPHRIHRNCIPHCDVFLENGYTKEEMKLVNESRKIMGIENLRLTATAVRVPVVGGHSESVNVSFKKPADIHMIRKVLEETSGVVVLDQPEKNVYPTPLESSGKNEVFVGRIREDLSAENTFNLWIVADNLRKGAATNAVQILKAMTDAEYLS